eukprot:scaffold20934_cov116-Isochrysis_galbana.AAC.7
MYDGPKILGAHARRGGTYVCNGTRAKSPSCSRCPCPCPGGTRRRARRRRTCCCRSTAAAVHSQHEGRAAAIASRRGSAPDANLRVARGVAHRSARRCQLSAYL